MGLTAHALSERRLRQLGRQLDKQLFYGVRMNRYCEVIEATDDGCKHYEVDWLTKVATQVEGLLFCDGCRKAKLETINERIKSGRNL